MVQRDFHFAIVDEVDSILIDEARTPLIISGPAESNSALYHVADGDPQLTADDFDLDEKANSITLTEAGIEHAENLCVRLVQLIREHCMILITLDFAPCQSSAQSPPFVQA